MKLWGITEENIDKFFKLVDECEGKVEVVSEDFRLNLKSNFVKYVSLAKIFLNKEVKEIELILYNQNDVNKFVDFMMYE